MRLKSEFLSWLLFFFSSRRRHTRFKCDWSSDVCSSDLNGQLADRGAPSDYDEWEQKGAQGWGWNAVLPYFKKGERDMDFDGPWHGKDGRIPVRRILPDTCCGHAQAAAQAFKDAGYDFIEDQNGESQRGYFPITVTNLYHAPVSAGCRCAWARGGGRPTHPAGTCCWRCASPRGRQASRRATCSSRSSANLPGTRSASRSPRSSSASTRRCPRPGRSGLPRATGMPSRSSSSTSYRTAAISNG